MSEQPATFPVAAVCDRRPALEGRAATPFAAEARRGTESAPYFAALARLPVRAVDALLWLYQKLVSPALHVAAPSCGCRFAPTCSHYAREALREHGLLAGLALTVRRLVKCGPWHPGGLDPVPPRKLSCIKVNQVASAES